MKILLKISYDGTFFCGFQAQKDVRTVQKVLTEASGKVFGIPCNVTGCSRTDSGVHARCFCATVEPATGSGDVWDHIPAGKIHKAYDSVLPHDVSVMMAAEVEDDFHARYSVKGKTYEYLFSTLPYRDPFDENRKYRTKDTLTDQDIKRMDDCAAGFVGTHDFSSFMAMGSKIKDPVRTVTCAEVFRRDGGCIAFSVSADGFLYNMVRIMAGTLLDAGSPGDIEKIIQKRNREFAGITLPPYALYLTDVRYDTDICWKCD